MTQTWPAPAKINLFLHILGRRDDGYHNLQTAFQFLDYCDRLTINVRDDGSIRRVRPVPGVAEADDVCVRAARLLQRESGVGFGADIGVDKRIPAGGGLGGGSSNAATVLVALNRLWGLDWEPSRLAALGLRLGADVPVFIHGVCAWAEGVGERLEPLEWDRPWYLVIAPPVHVSTAELFGAPDLTRYCPPITIRHLARGRVENVFEPVVRRCYPEVGRALDWLSGATRARMTGTGACVFGAFDSEPAARAVLGRFRDEYPSAWQAFVARGLNRSPLMDTIDRHPPG
jgi:4-diphosphocytidyl-2-C-methyl-D-erythritol kinase